MGVARDFLAFVLVMLIEALFVHLAAMLVLRGSRFYRALTVSVVASLIGFLVEYAFETRFDILANLVVFIVWLAMTVAVYHTTWFRAFVIAMLAYVFWIGTRYLTQLDWRGLVG